MKISILREVQLCMLYKLSWWLEETHFFSIPHYPMKCVFMSPKSSSILHLLLKLSSIRRPNKELIIIEMFSLKTLAIWDAKWLTLFQSFSFVFFSHVSFKGSLHNIFWQVHFLCNVEETLIQRFFLPNLSEVC